MKIAVATLGERFDDRDVIKSFASVATHLILLTPNASCQVSLSYTDDREEARNKISDYTFSISGLLDHEAASSSRSVLKVKVKSIAPRRERGKPAVGEQREASVIWESKARE